MKKKNVEPSKEVEKRKQSSSLKQFKRAMLILLNTVLACYLIYCVYDGIVEFYNKNFANRQSDIYLIDKYSEKKSLEIYNKILAKNEASNEYITSKAYDFSFTSGYLNFKSTKNEATENNELLISSYETYTLREISHLDNVYERIDPYKYLGSINSGINLFDTHLKDGTYIVYPYNYTLGQDNPGPLKIESEKGIEKTYYSPYFDNVRRKINIKSKSSSPCLIIELSSIYTCEDTYNDIAILYSKDEEKEIFKSHLSNSNLLVKYIASSSEENNIVALYKEKANVNIIFEDRNDILVSHYLNIDSLKIEVPLIKNDTLSLNKYTSIYDNDNYIRELGGHLFNAGGCKGVESTYYLASYKNEYDAGSITIKLNISDIDYLDFIFNSLLNYSL